MKYYLTIAASDNSGGAGIQQDLKVAESMGHWGLSAITGITVQNFKKLDSIYPIPANILSQQIEMNINSFNINACKIGAVCSEENIQVISSILKKYELKNIILDTIFSPTYGKAFINYGSIKLFKEKLLPHVNIITPNKDELSLLAGKEILNFEQGIEAALDLAKQYNCCIYMKGGHYEGNTINEALINKNKVVNFEKERLTLKYSHGTGCTFSTALTCYLGNGLSLKEACVKASEYVNYIYKKYSLLF